MSHPTKGDLPPSYNCYMLSKQTGGETSTYVGEIFENSLSVKIFILYVSINI